MFRILALWAFLVATAVVGVFAEGSCAADGSFCDASSSQMAASASRVLLQRDVSSKDDMVLTATEDDSFMHVAFGSPFNATKALDSLLAIGNKLSNQKQPMTPELKALLETLVDMVRKAKADEGFKESLAEAQQQINASVTQVNTLASQQDTAKPTADASDEALVLCVQSEVEMLEQVKTCEAAIEKDEQDEDEACKEKEDARPFEVNLTGSCDLGNKDCSAMISKLKEDLRAAESVLADRKEKYAELEAACNESISKKNQLKEECANKTAALAEKVQECMAKEVDASKAKCGFGTLAQEFCHAWNQSKALAANLQKSNKRRQQSWKTFEALECILTKFQKHGNLTNADKKECENGIDYATGVGELDLMDDKIDKEHTEICSASTVTFSGFKWQIPSPRGAKASPEDYVKETDSPAITITPLGSSPFEECTSLTPKSSTTAPPEEP